MGRKRPAEEKAAGSARTRRRPDQRPPGEMHPAGPHARPELTDFEATPGTGALPDITKDKDVDPGID
ncbi:MAG: hypothetical protein KJZ80_08315 [Hyphomicrobiaceae bacterium]|nr:hypothetical protein [Hyphomicrobiaceae bacterium]